MSGQAPDLLADSRSLRVAGHVQHLHPGGGERRCCGCDRLVQPSRALRPAGDQQDGAGGQAEVGAAPLAGGGPVQGRDLLAERDAQHLRPAQPGAGDGGRDVRGQPGADPVGQPRPGVGLVDHQRRPTAAAREVGRQRDVATEADHDVGPDPVQVPTGHPDGAGKTTR